MTTQLQVRHDTAANWTSNNPTLLAGEIGFETDTYKFKIGTGLIAWTSLPYGTTDIASPPAIGNTTPNTGDFTTLTATTGNITNVSSTTASFTTLTATSGQGFSNVQVYTAGSGTWTLPAAVQSTGAKFKVTVVGGGGNGGSSGSTSGTVGGGGGGAGVAVRWFTYVAGQNSATYAVSSGGSDSIFTYNSVTCRGAGGSNGSTSGAGGAGGAGTDGDINIAGQPGASGGTMAATSNYIGNGGNSPLGYGYGGQMPATAAGANGVAGSGYGGGGSGGRTGTGTTSRTGGSGSAGVIVIEY